MNVTIESAKGKAFQVPKRAVASINPQNCVNCGKCRELCPVEAIEEQQRVICRLCPSCTLQPALTHGEMEALATQTSCTVACPLGVSPQGYVNLVRVGKEKEAFVHIWDKNPLPSVCGRICHHPCEQACKRGKLVDTPIGIRAIKRYLTETAEEAPAAYPSIYEETVAVIGAGPAGLTAAHCLSLAGHKVTVFDSHAEPGGMLRRGLPEFRLPRDVIKKDIQRLKDAGLEIRLGAPIGKRDMEQLKEEYDAIVVATGAPQARELKIDGWRKEGVMTALSFMERIGQNQQIWRHPGQEFRLDGDVVVIGGGSVAMDCARIALRYGASSVTVTCLETGTYVPAHAWEREEAEEEGIVIQEGLAPQRFLGVHNELTGVDFAAVERCAKDENGRLQFDINKENRSELKVDWVIVAIGQQPDALWNTWAQDEMVFFAGDVRSSICSVVDAMASGKKAAMDIIARLHGVQAKDPLELRVLHQAPVEQKIYPATRIKIDRPAPHVLDAAQRTQSFAEVEAGFTPEEIEVETRRCLACGYQTVNVDKCIGCGVCKSVCPKGDVITMVPAQEGGKTI